MSWLLRSAFVQQDTNSSFRSPVMGSIYAVPYGMTTLWTTLERPGYFGSRRDAIETGYNETYGPEGWRLAWQWGEQWIERPEMSTLYEDAYYNFLSQQPTVLEELLAVASEVYDDQPSNVHSGYDYRIQETTRTHVQDIAIRRAVFRLGRVFAGTELLQIRDALGSHPLSTTLSPGHVPFHRPDRLTQPEIEGWWQPGSVESFYQSNKYLQVLTTELA
jgi:hypothetical protein